MSHPPTTPAIAAAHAVAFATYLDGKACRSALDAWRNLAPAGEIRRVDPVHDALTVVLQRDLEPAASLADAVRLVAGLPLGSLPKQDLLGATTFLVVKSNDPAVGSLALQEWLGGKTGVIESDPWDDRACAFAGAVDSSRVVVVCPPGDAADRRLAERLYANVRLMEALRHKIESQFAEYDGRVRPALLAANETLDRELRPLADLLLQPPDPKVTRTMDLRGQASAAYCAALSSLAPAQRIRAMLEANLGNLDQLADDSFSGRRARRERQRLAQIDADLGLVRPTLETAQALTESHHCHLLERINLAELRDGRQRDSELGERERQNRRLVMFGVWLGLTQVWEAYLSLLPASDRPTGFWLVVLSLFPVFVGLALVSVEMFRKESRS